MVKKLAFKDHREDIRIFKRRIIIAAIAVIGLTGLLIFRLDFLQINQHYQYRTLSNQNQLTLLPIPPKRGLIYDRNGKLLAENLPIYNLEMIPDKVGNLDQTLNSLKSIVKITPLEIERFKKALKQHRKFETVPLKIKLTEEEVARFYVNQHHYPGMLINTLLVRHYPEGKETVDALGYVGRINENELKTINKTTYAATHFIGKIGIEKSYEKALHGKAGYQQVETDASGRIIRILERTPPIPGDNLYLTIDTDVQKAAKKSLEGYRGAVVAIDPNNGEVLALVSHPSYDPNLFVQGIPSKIYKALQDDIDRPLFNRSIRGQYAFGSTIKPFLALQGLNTGTITTHTRIQDPGWFKLPTASHIFHDWKKNGHGRVGIRRAIIISCDTFFYRLASKMGIRNIDKIMEQFSFGKETGLDINEELPGLVPTPEWKRASQGESWYGGDTVLSGIGQGYMLTTPLQLAVGASGIAMRGHFYHPHLLLKHQSPDQKEHPFKPKAFEPINLPDKYWNTVIDAMQQVVGSPMGTGYRRFGGHAPYTAAGKTGTAQLFRYRNMDKSKIPERLRDNTLFIVFAPVHNPKIAVGVVLENSNNAPVIARQVTDAYLIEKKDETTTLH